MSALHIALICLARPTFDIPLAEAVAATVRQRLLAAGARLSGPEALVMDAAAARAAAAGLAAAPPDLLLVLQATFADSTLITTLAEATDAPLLLWATPEAPTGGRLRLNALCGINLAAHALNLRRRAYDTVYAAADDAAVWSRIETLARAGRAGRRLRGARLAVVGHHPDGMDTCRLDKQALAATFGLEVVEIPLPALFRRMAAVPVETVAGVRRRLSDRLENLDQLAAEPLNGTLRAYAALDGMAAERKVAGYAVRCWPEFFEEEQCAACGALSLLNEAHIPASCEADANGTVTQLMLQAISDGPTFDCDLVSVDGEADQAVIWHCGKAPLSMADPDQAAAGGIHSNRRLPLVMDFPLRPGRITVARLSQSGGRLRLVVGGGQVLAAPPSFAGTSGVVRFDRPATDVLDTILSQGLEHHLAITYGDFGPALKAVAGLFDIPVLELT